jgi:universal stress protein E
LTAFSGEFLVATIRQILTIIDPSTRAQPCVNKAARLARSYGADLELFICDNSREFRSNRYVAEQIYEAALADRRARHDAQLESLAGPLRQQGLRVTTDVAFEDSLHAGIIEKARALKSNIVIKDTHYHGPIRRAFLTNTDWHLIRECPMPLLLTKPAVWRSVVTFVAAVDPGHEDDKPATLDRELLTMTEQLASSVHGNARAVHVFDPIPLFAVAVPGTAEGIGAGWATAQYVETLRGTHQHSFNELIAAFPAFAGHADFLEGAPAVALPDYVADTDIDVMVLGAVSRSGLQRLLVGSTAERLLDRLPCDILVAKPCKLMEQMLAVATAA